jgi:hypothetical protein
MRSNRIKKTVATRSQTIATAQSNTVGFAIALTDQPTAPTA